MTAAAVQTIPGLLPDIQAEAPQLPIALDEAGISDLRYPITVHLTDGSHHHTVANVSLSVSVAADSRGVHMSRLVELIHDWHRRISVLRFADLLADLAGRLDSDSAYGTLRFPLFLERSAPVTGVGAYVPIDCVIRGGLTGSELTCALSVRVPVQSLCPCSREISDYGAHNQRGSVEIAVDLDPVAHTTALDFETLVVAAEQAASAPIFSVLKRPDERHVTMRAYENPAFVEDITRSVADLLRKDTRIRSGHVHVVNEESIHSHNAYATTTWRR
jgi:GTP cyclohydrolase FolE2